MNKREYYEYLEKFLERARLLAQLKELSGVYELEAPLILPSHTHVDFTGGYVVMKEDVKGKIKYIRGSEGKGE